MGIILTCLLSIFGLTQQDEIQKIRLLYNQTESSKGEYERVYLDDFENSSEGGQLTAFAEDSEIKLIEAIYYGHTGKAKYYFYISDSKVYFIFSQTYNYNAPATSEQYDESKTSLEENRYYFWDTGMIRWLKPDGQQVNTELGEFKSEEKEMLTWANTIIRKFE